MQFADKLLYWCMTIHCVEQFTSESGASFRPANEPFNFGCSSRRNDFSKCTRPGKLSSSLTVVRWASRCRSIRKSVCGHRPNQSQSVIVSCFFPSISQLWVSRTCCASYISLLRTSHASLPEQVSCRDSPSHSALFCFATSDAVTYMSTICHDISLLNALQ